MLQTASSEGGMPRAEGKRQPIGLALPYLFLAACCLLPSGCAAMTNPVAEGIPARRVPAEFLAEPRDAKQSIPLNLLGQTPPAAYLVAPGDILGVYIDGFLGERNLAIPIHLAPVVQDFNQRRLQPSSGYPVPVEPDGTIALPLAGSLSVTGMTLAQVRDAIREHYISRQLIKRETERILVSLLQPRQVQVMVVRQEASAFTQAQLTVIPSSKQGSGFVVELVAYENDVLHALMRTGGLPGLDACNEILIHRNVLARVGVDPQLQRAGMVVRIPLRQCPGKLLPIKPQDVILGPGDVVYLEARDKELFYTGGLLPPGEFILPRDHDMDVVEAIAYVRGSLINGAFGGSNLSGLLINPGIGNPSPTHLTVVRRTPNGGVLPIIVDLATALRDPSERILIKAGDLLVLQETPGEAMVRYFTQTFFNFNLVWEAFHSKFATGVIDISAPDRLPGRLEQLNIPRQ